jgi:hypothetical protein
MHTLPQDADLSQGAWPCTCPADLADPDDFCGFCRRSWSDWLDALWNERRAVDLQTAGLDCFAEGLGNV